MLYSLLGFISWIILFKLFPGLPNASSACGGGGGTKGEERQADAARQTEARTNLLNQFQAQLVPGSPEFLELQTLGTSFLTTEQGDPLADITALGNRLVKQQQARIGEGGPASVFEQRTQADINKLLETGAFTPEEKAVFNALRGQETTTPTGDIFAQLTQRAQDPSQFFDSTFQEQLSLSEEANRVSFARRGLLRSGLEQEGATRASNELAVQEARAREDFRQQQLQNFQGLFDVGQQLRQREIALSEVPLNINLGREDSLTQLLAQQSQNAFGRTATAQQTQQATFAQQLQDAISANNQQNAAIGQGVGTLAGAFFGPAGAAVGNAIGGSVSGLLGAQRAAPQQTTQGGGQASLSGGLSTIDPTLSQRLTGQNRRILGVEELLKALS